ncbi:hypothetical protein GCM10011515_01180 [Tsuneonella deserti]|uniref:Uncharacterized protein n=1 Tax=Tsuneonella deserti TaxID=2035528 RepID=A0ABQ1RWB7_9SPHN|nr:hypothetical protein [Tsuneonella deserti]GGD85255.1 hypothetical protein GCM10011515_01180 [Tsuneonella deserti]
MNFWLIAGSIFALALLAGLAAPRKPAAKRDPPSPPPQEEDLWTADALARLGTPETVADLVAQGREEELRGLGYAGELPPES